MLCSAVKVRASYLNSISYPQTIVPRSESSNIRLFSYHSNFIRIRYVGPFVVVTESLYSELSVSDVSSLSICIGELNHFRLSPCIRVELEIPLVSITLVQYLYVINLCPTNQLI